MVKCICEIMKYLFKIISGIRDDSGELYHTMANTYLGEAAATGILEDKLPGLLDVRESDKFIYF